MANKKEIKSTILTQTKQLEVPNISKNVIERIRTLNQFQDNTSNEVYNSKNQSKKIFINLKTNFFKVGLVLTVFILGLFVVLGLSDNNVHNKNSISKSHQTFALQAVTLFNYADSTGAISLLGLDNSKYQEIAEDINEYYLTAINVLNKEEIEYQELVSDNPSYQRMIIISSKILSQSYQYTLYFTEEIINENDKDKDFDEIDSRINGIIKTNKTEYRVEGFKEIEKDECEIKLIMYITDTEYFVVKQEIEKKENEYSYEYYKNGKVIEEFDISYETKGLGKTVIELESETINNEVNCEFSFFDDHVKVEYEINNNEGKVEIFEEEEQYRYEFKNGINIFINKK